MRRIICLTAVGALIAGTAGAEPSRSAAAAMALAKRLSARHIEAIAVRDGQDRERFVAALYFPGSQLLVVADRFSQPQYLEDLLARKEYRQIYIDLQGAPDNSRRMFVHDFKADGLVRDESDQVDMFSEADRQIVFTNAWRKQQRLSDRDYLEAFRRADGIYTALLTQLLDAVGDEP